VIYLPSIHEYASYFEVNLPDIKDYRIFETWNRTEKLLIFSFTKKELNNEQLKDCSFKIQIGKRTEKGNYNIEIFLDTELLVSHYYNILKNEYQNWHDEFMNVFSEVRFNLDPKDNPVQRNSIKTKVDVFDSRSSANMQIIGPIFSGKNYIVPDAIFENSEDKQSIIVEIENENYKIKIDQFLNIISYCFGLKEMYDRFTKNIKTIIEEWHSDSENSKLVQQLGDICILFHTRNRFFFFNEIESSYINFERGFTQQYYTISEQLEIFDREGCYYETTYYNEYDYLYHKLFFDSNFLPICLLILNSKRKLKKANDYLKMRLNSISIFFSYIEWNRLGEELIRYLSQNIEIRFSDCPGRYRRMFSGELLARALIPNVNLLYALNE